MAIADHARHEHLDPEQRNAADGDLREFLRLADQLEELVVVEDADPQLEIGALFELSLEHEYPPILLFDRIKGFPPGYRIVVNMKSSRVLGEENTLEAVREFRRGRVKVPAPIPPEDVESGPVFGATPSSPQNGANGSRMPGQNSA